MTLVMPAMWHEQLDGVRLDLGRALLDRDDIRVEAAWIAERDLLAQLDRAMPLPVVWTDEDDEEDHRG